jgi:hypothetical protein
MFQRRHLLGRKTIVFLVLALLISQLALANYLCPAQAPQHDMAAMMAAGLPCDGMDPAQPALCHQHAADPGQLVQVAQVLSPSLPTVIHVLVVPEALSATDAVAIPRASTPEAQPPPDPIFLATLRLRV